MNQNNHTDEVILGVDTHLDVHVGAVVSASGNYSVRNQFQFMSPAILIS